MTVLRMSHLLLAVPALFASANLIAAPWLEPGDARARHSVQKLSDKGHYAGSVTTWPIMWADIDQSQKRAGDNSVAMQQAYLSFEMEQQARSGFRGELELNGSTEPAFLRGFQQLPREEGELRANLQWQGEAWAVGLAPSAIANPQDDNAVRLDGSYIAATVGNWVLGAGAIERWWGPGWQSTMILSNNARPIPAVWVDRKTTLAPETKWLSWIGPWRLNVFLGQLEEERAIPDAKLLGMRFTFSPVERLEIGLSRTIMFGGEGRPEGFSTVWDAFIGKDNV